MAKQIGHLKSKHSTYIVVLGNGELIQTLMAERLIDQYLLLIHPIVLGQGRKLFRDGGATLEFATVETVLTKGGS